jgi:hypothetical protein
LKRKVRKLGKEAVSDNILSYQIKMAKASWQWPQIENFWGWGSYLTQSADWEVWMNQFNLNGGNSKYESRSI